MKWFIPDEVYAKFAAAWAKAIPRVTLAPGPKGTLDGKSGQVIAHTEFTGDELKALKRLCKAFALPVDKEVAHVRMVVDEEPPTRFAL